MGTIILLCMGALTLQRQDLPIDVSPPDPLSGQVSTNFRLADIDGNQQLDLVLPDTIFLQVDKRFQTDHPIPMYAVGERAYMDLWKGELYFRTANRLAVVRWSNGAWQVEREQSMKWPSPTPETGDETAFSDTKAEVVFERFLHDFDTDGTPEIVLPGIDGLHVYHSDGKTYEEKPCAAVFPPLRVANAPASALWPPEARRIAFPAREMACKYLLDANRATMLSRETVSERQSRYRVTTYTLDPANRSEWTSEPMSNEMRPCRLASDGTLAFAGGDWELSEATSLPVPVFETRATFDRGKTWQSFRAVSFRPQCLFVDADGDGQPDLVTESIGLLEGGIRESVSRFLSARQIEHTVAIRLQHDKTFSSKPEWQTRLTVALDAPPFRNTEFFQRYQAGELIDLTGDFNGDRRHDLLVQDRIDRLAVYLSNSSGFGTAVDATIAVEPNARFAACDVDGDGRSDVVVFPAPGKRVAQVWFSRAATP